MTLPLTSYTPKPSATPFPRSISLRVELGNRLCKRVPCEHSASGGLDGGLNVVGCLSMRWMWYKG